MGPGFCVAFLALAENVAGRGRRGVGWAQGGEVGVGLDADEDDAEATTSGDVVQPLRVDRLTRTASRMTRIFFISITSLLKFVASS